MIERNAYDIVLDSLRVDIIIDTRGASAVIYANAGAGGYYFLSPASKHFGYKQLPVCHRYTLCLSIEGTHACQNTQAILPLCLRPPDSIAREICVGLF